MVIQRTIARLASPPGVRGKLSVLIFHRVRPQIDPFEPEALVAEQFDRILGWVSRCFNVLAPDEAVERLRDGALPAAALAITFDDGYADNVEVALPILRRHNLRAAFFIATDYLDGGIMWNDAITAAFAASPLEELDLTEFQLGVQSMCSLEARRAAVARLLPVIKYYPLAQRNEVVAAIVEKNRIGTPRDLMMSSEQLRALKSAGMVIGGHTCAHPILAATPPSEAEREIALGKERIESILGEPIELFAYPNGKPGRDYSEEHVAMVRRAGFHAAFSTTWGVSGAQSDIFQLPRFTPWDTQRWRFLLRIAGNTLRPGVARA